MRLQPTPASNVALKSKTKAPNKSPDRSPDRPRRTQQERREATIRLLLDAATETLIEVGYANASVQRVAASAGVSQGALFGHFPTREALMVAVGADVGQKLLTQYERDFVKVAGKRGATDRLTSAMHLLRAACRSELNQAWYELKIAARTSPSLKKALQPVVVQYNQDIERAARRALPELAHALGENLVVLLDTMIAVFDGETVSRLVLANPAVEKARMKMLTDFAQTLLAAG